MLVFQSNFFFTWVVPIDYVCVCASAWVVSTNQAVEIHKILQNCRMHDSNMHTHDMHKMLHKVQLNIGSMKTL